MVWIYHNYSKLFTSSVFLNFQTYQWSRRQQKGPVYLFFQFKIFFVYLHNSEYISISKFSSCMNKVCDLNAQFLLLQYGWLPVSPTECPNNFFHNTEYLISGLYIVSTFYSLVAFDEGRHILSIVHNSTHAIATWASRRDNWCLFTCLINFVGEN